MGTDLVCLDTDEQVCVSDFEFFVIKSASGLNGNDGILGLSPPNESQNGPSYIKALYKQGTIDEEVATFWLNSYGEENSMVTFGGKPENASRGESFKQDLVKRYDEWWTVNLHTVEYGGNDIKDSGIGYAILDTGTSLLYLGTEDYYNFADQMLSQAPLGALDCTSLIYCFSDTLTCDELSPHLSPLKIQLEDNYYTLPAASYMFDRGNIYQKKCTIGISYTDSTSGVYILGDTFLRNFVTTFDYNNSEMELVINVNAPDGVEIMYKMSTWKIFMIVLGCLVALALLIWMVICCCKKCRKNKTKKAYVSIGG